MNKYKLLRKNKEGLHRIKAVIDFSDVKAGDLGGFVESEANLSHNGNCWIYDNGVVRENGEVFGNAQVYDNALVFGHAKVRDYALVFGNAQVFDNALVSENARVRDYALVFGHTQVFDNAQVFGHAKVRDYALVCGNAIATKPVIYIAGLCQYNITITDNHIRIGCIQYTFDEAIDISSDWETAKVDNPRLTEVEHIKDVLFNIIIERIKEITK